MHHGHDGDKKEGETGGKQKDRRDGCEAKEEGDRSIRVKGHPAVMEGCMKEHLIFAGSLFLTVLQLFSITAFITIETL